jgi:hypothetical protein
MRTKLKFNRMNKKKTMKGGDGGKGYKKSIAKRAKMTQTAINHEKEIVRLKDRTINKARNAINEILVQQFNTLYKKLSNLNFTYKYEKLADKDKSNKFKFKIIYYLNEFSTEQIIDLDEDEISKRSKFFNICVYSILITNIKAIHNNIINYFKRKKGLSLCELTYTNDEKGLQDINGAIDGIPSIIKLNLPGFVSIVNTYNSEEPIPIFELTELTELTGAEGKTIYYGQILDKPNPTFKLLIKKNNGGILTEIPHKDVKDHLKQQFDKKSVSSPTRQSSIRQSSRAAISVAGQSVSSPTVQPSAPTRQLTATNTAAAGKSLSTSEENV